MDNINLNLFFFVFNLSGKNLLLDQIMIFGAVYLIFIIPFIMIYSIIQNPENRKAIITSILSYLMALLIIQLIRVFVFEPRPFVSNFITPLIKLEADDSFPSLHTSVAAAITFSYGLTKSKIFLLLLIILLIIGFSRIYIGVHFPLDIIAGILVGFLSAYIAQITLKWTIKKLI